MALFSSSSQVFYYDHPECDVKRNRILEVWKETLVMISMLIIFIGISAARFKERLQ